MEAWLRKEADDKSKKAESRRSYARSGLNYNDEDRHVADVLAEQVSGRKLPKTSRTEDEKSEGMQERIAPKLEEEAPMLKGFADFVRD